MFSGIFKMKLTGKLKNLSQNDKIVLKNSLGAFAVKGASLIVSLFTAPAFLKYFNDNVVLGIWYTLLSVLTWFLNFDLGIGNGIRNNLVKAFSGGDRKEAKKIISSGLFAIIAVSLAIFVVGIISVIFIDLNSLFNISAEIISYSALKASVIYIFCAIMLRFTLSFVNSVFYSLQKSAVNNFLGLCISVLQLLFVLIFKFETAEESLTALSVAYLVISNLPYVVAGIIVFATTLKDCRPNVKYVDSEHGKKVLSVGGVFFVCQIAYMLIVNTNEFIITRYFSPEYTTLYSFYYKITSLISMVITLTMTPVWSIVTKAMVEKDFVWLDKLYKKIKIFGIFAIAAQFVLIPVLQFIMDIWLGNGVVVVDYITAIAFACFGGAFVYSGMLSTIVCGLGRMKLQTICYLSGVVLKIIVIAIAINYLNAGWNVVVLSNAIVLIPYCVLQQIDLDRYFKKQKAEIGTLGNCEQNDMAN